MKLHLPKMLCMALIATVVTTSASGDEPTYINVGLAENPKGGDNIFTLADSYLENSSINEGKMALVVNSGDKVGYFKENESTDNFTTTFESASDTTPVGTAVISKSLDINGGLEINGTGQVYIGGKSNSNSYACIWADDVVINGTNEALTNVNTRDVSSCHNLNLRADAANFASLTINGGAAFLSTYETGGGDSIVGPNTLWGSYKSVLISGLLKVTDGYLQTGHKDTSNVANTQKQIKSIFKGGIEQTGGEIYVTGKMCLGENNTQSGGKMTLATQTGAVDRLLLYATTTTISQSNKAEMIIDGIIDKYQASSYSSKNAQLHLSQTGAGTIKISNGVQFTTASGKNSTISQTGGGTINLSGSFSSAVFDITQSKGTINLNNGATMQSNKLALDTNALLNIAGSLTLNEGGTFEITVNSAHDAAISIEATGSLAATNQALSLSMDEAVVSDMMDTVESATESGLLTYTIDLISSTDKSKLDTLLGQLTWEWEGLPQTAALAADTLTTVVTYDYIDSGLVVNDMGDGTYMLQAATNWNVTVTEQIPEPATATLSLLALAGLAARRRRR